METDFELGMKKTFQKASLNVFHKQEAVFQCTENGLKKPARNKKSISFFNQK